MEPERLPAIPPTYIDAEEISFVLSERLSSMSTLKEHFVTLTDAAFATIPPNCNEFVSILEQFNVVNWSGSVLPSLTPLS